VLLPQRGRAWHLLDAATGEDLAPEPIGPAGPGTTPA
jgi:hypothetical protein